MHSPEYGGTKIEEPSIEEKRQIWSYVQRQQEETGNDQWVTGPNGKNDAKLHFLDDDEVRCMKHKVDRQESWVRKEAYIFPFDYRDLCLECVKDWREEE